MNSIILKFAFFLTKILWGGVKPIIYLLTFILAITVPLKSYCQDTDKEEKEANEQGTTENIPTNTLNQQILIEKEKIVKLPTFTKLYQWETLVPKLKSNDFMRKKLIAPEAKVFGWHDKLSAIAMDEVTMEDKYYSYIKFGVGNFFSSYLEVAYLNPDYPNTMINYGTRLIHQGAINGPLNNDSSGFNKQNIEGFLDYNFKKWNFHLNTNLNLNHYQYYGIFSLPNATNDRTVQKNNFYNVRTQGIITYNRGVFNGITLEMAPALISYRGQDESKEDTFNFSSKGWIDLNTKYRLSLDTQFLSSNLGNKFIRDTYRYFVRFNPILEFDYRQLELGTGVNINFGNDRLNETSNTNLMVNLWMKYPLSDLTRIFLGINGDTTPRLLSDMMLSMPYLGSYNLPTNERNIYVSYLGFKTYDIKNLYVNTTLKYSLTQNYMAYQNNVENPEFFDSLYLGKGNILSLDAQARYKFNAAVSLDIKVKYYNYNFKVTPYNLPEYEIEFGSDFDILEKIYARVGGYISGGRKYLNLFKGYQLEELDVIFDIYGKFDYKVSETINVFLHLNNILNANYMNYHLYPSKSINILVGGSYKL